MPQTLLSIFALALLSFLMLGTLEDRKATQTDRLGTVVADHARAVAAGHIDRALRLPFDGSAGPRTLPAAFGIPGGVAVPASLDSAWALHVGDLDDLDGLGGEVVTLVGDPTTGADRPLVLRSAFAVEYVAMTSTGWAATADTTAQKRLTVWTTDPASDVRVELQHIVSDLRARPTP